MTNKRSFTDQQLYEMSVHEIYHIEERRKGEKFTDPITNTTYTVVDIECDAQTGLDAIALRDENNNIMIVYGGTDTKAGCQDVISDAQIGGTYIGLSAHPEQFEQAKAFRNRVAQMHPDNSITLTGHSLGGAVSNVVALESGDAAINFNPAPLPYDFHTVYGNGANRTDIINYQTFYDPLRIASVAYGGYLPGQLKVFQTEHGTIQEEHNMAKVKFDSEGYLLDIQKERVFHFINSNINTGNTSVDEAYRGLVMSFSGTLTFISGALSVSAGVSLFLMPGMALFGGIVIIGGIATATAGLFSFFVGLGREIVALKNVLLENGKWLFSCITNIIKMVQAVTNGFLMAAQKMLNDVVAVYGVLAGSLGALIEGGLMLSRRLILVVYDRVEAMSHCVQDIALFVQQIFQKSITAFINFKDQLFNMTYTFIAQSVQTLFDVADIIALLGSAAMQFMADIVTLNWDKISDHVLEKIYAYEIDLKHDFFSTTRGFDHYLAEEIYQELQLLANNIRAFSEKIKNISTTFKVVEGDLSMQMKYIGG